MHQTPGNSERRIRQTDSLTRCSNSTCPCPSLSNSHVCASNNTPERTHKRVSTLNRHHRGESPFTSWRACASRIRPNGDHTSPIKTPQVRSNAMQTCGNSGASDIRKNRHAQELVENPEVRIPAASRIPFHGDLVTENCHPHRIVCCKLVQNKRFTTKARAIGLSTKSNRTKGMICMSLLNRCQDQAESCSIQGLPAIPTSPSMREQM